MIYLDKTEQEIAIEFFQAPTGTILCETGAYFQSAIYAVKLPIGNDTRFSMVLAERLSKHNFNETKAYPPKDWSLSLDSYVDNETGQRIICAPCSQFGQILDYREGTPLARAYAEIEAAVRKKLLATSDEILFFAAHSASKNPDLAQALSGEERKRIRADCERAFAFHTVSNPDSRFLTDLELEHHEPNSARFAISYFKDKSQFIQNLTNRLMPKYAIDIIHHRAIKEETKRCMEEICRAPSPALLKEHAIRSVISGKSSIWVTFGRGEQTLRMLSPTAMFHSNTELLKWVLPDKERARLETFLGNTNHTPARIDDIVALDYKGKTLYRDETFYAMHHDNTQIV